MHVGLVPALWAAIAVFALPDALLAPDAHGPVNVAANVFVFFAALLLLVHAAAKIHRPHAAHAAYAHAAYAQAAYAQAAYAPLPSAYTAPPQTCPNHTHDYTLCCVRTTTHPQIELTHLFIHILCLAYVRIACWFEFRAFAAALFHSDFASSISSA
jgi:hypothetical protein